MPAKGPWSTQTSRQRPRLRGCGAFEKKYRGRFVSGRRVVGDFEGLGSSLVICRAFGVILEERGTTRESTERAQRAKLGFHCET